MRWKPSQAISDDPLVACSTSQADQAKPAEIDVALKTYTTRWARSISWRTSGASIGSTCCSPPSACPVFGWFSGRSSELHGNVSAAEHPAHCSDGQADHIRL